MKAKTLVIILFSLSLSLTNAYSSNTFPHRYAHAMVYVEDLNKIILFGGTNGDERFNDTWEFDVSNEKWSEVIVNGDKPNPNYHHTIAYIGNGKVILFGGYDDEDKCIDDTWEYNAITKSWRIIDTIGSKPGPRTAHSMVYIGDSKALLFGGVWYNDTWVYDAASHNWSEIIVTGTKPVARYGHGAMVYLEDANKVIMFGGDYTDEECDCGRQLNDTWEYDITNQTWSEIPISGDKPSHREHIAMSYAGNNKILMHGGTYYPDGKYEGGVGQVLLDDLWEYNVVSQNWTQIVPNGDIPPELSSHAMEYIGNNAAIMFSGWSTWKYDTQTQTWTEIVQFGGIDLRYAQHRVYENGSEYNRLLFGLIDLYDDSYYTPDDIIQSVTFYDPKGSEVPLSNMTYHSRKSFHGIYNARDSRWIYDQEPFFESSYIAQLEIPLVPGEYRLEAIDNEGYSYESSFEFNEQIDLPIISANTFQGYFDNLGNFRCKWDIPLHLSNDLRTSARAFIDSCMDDTCVAELSVRMPSHLGYIFVPSEIIQLLRSEGNLLKFGVQLRTNDNNNRSYSNSVDIDQITMFSGSDTE